MQIGFAAEEHTRQYESLTGGVDFIEYGCSVSRGVAGWAQDLARLLGVEMVLHPLDVSLFDGAVDGIWLSKMRELVAGARTPALVSDALYWSWGPQRHVWPRSLNLRGTEARCRETASRIAATCGVPFRVENPPLDWQPEPLDVWAFLDAASDAPGVEICLDLSHFLQGATNLNCGSSLPKGSYPWHRVTELHLAGYLEVSYLSRRFRLDDHACPLAHEQLQLLEQILDRRGGAAHLQICLEMEGHEASALLTAANSIRSLVQKGGR